MKKLLLICVACYAVTAYAQDVIVKRDGSTIISKVLEVNQTEIKYKKFSNQQGPTYTINKSEVMAINYEGGDKDTFENEPNKKEQEAAQSHIISVTAASNNAEIISRYNRTYEHGKAIKEKAKQAKYGFCILGVGENSVLSTDDVEVEFRQEPYETGLLTMGNQPRYGIFERFFVQVHNKTNKIIYVDLGSTFRVMKNGESKSYYDTSQTTVNQGSGSGASVNLGAIAGAAGVGGTIGTLANGVNVGGGNMSSTSKTYSKQRIIAIPPGGRMPIEKYQRVTVKKGGSFGIDKFAIISDGEELSYRFRGNEIPPVMAGEKYIYKENESPYHAGYTITYSVDSDFKRTNVLKASVYIREIIGARHDDMSYNLHSNKDKMIEIAKDFILDYNDYTIVGEFEYSK